MRRDNVVSVFGKRLHENVLMYSKKFTPLSLQEQTREQNMAPRSAPLWEPKNSEFLRDSET